ncbi:dynein regulatory complex subunit 3 [Alosa sapidissima]|uniref:dynein regulatory complex subunit 3 n=1 Tax=Alosa sapidissima TaxID=34773 RepID=UPI001C0947BD|nr:dynein regulatory complex subunit 3 [Alosa sapidissima]XP_041943404.1 dynein regulatory complex subunit 3 [Alosa sapidissima]
MSRLHDTIEPSVVNEEMLQKAIVEQGPQGPAGRIAKEEGIEFDEVTQLRLEFLNILKIDHLWQFTALTKLQLDNNIIEKIEGLDSLVSLVWLDLSFNNIEKIEGLDKLVNLQDLSLFNNRISVIENIETLLSLQILSIGNNFISELDNVLYLRRFKDLRTLNLAGNPLCKEENYKIFIAAYLPDLVYLDYRLLDEKTREAAFAKYQYAIEEKKHNEAQEQKAKDEKKKIEEELQLHKDAFVEYLNGSYLFESMFADDAEATKLAHLPGVPTLLESFKNQLVNLCTQLFEAGLAQHWRRHNEVDTFFSCYREAVIDNQDRAAKLGAEFEIVRRQRVNEMHQMADSVMLDGLVDQHNEEISQLYEGLMTMELQLVDQLEDIIKDFERNISDMIAAFLEHVQGIFAQCRDLENHHHEKLLEIAVATLERIAKNEMEEDMPDEVRMLFVDKDTVTNAVSASHDNHLLKIDNREDAFVTRINTWLSALMKTIHANEGSRNRKRISEILNYADYVREQIEILLSNEQPLINGQ